MVDDTKSNRKTIQISESFLSFNKTKKAGKKKKKEKPKVILEPNSLRRTLLSKIKQFQQNEKIKNKIQSNEENKSKGTLLESIEYLEKRSQNMKQKHNQNQNQNQKGGQKNKTVKKPNYHGINPNRYPTANLNPPLISVDLPASFDSPMSINEVVLPSVSSPSIPPPSIPPPSIPSSIPIQSITSSSPISSGPLPQITTSSQNVIHSNHTSISKPTTKSNIINTEEPPVGCLKGGSKPTYRQYYNKTLKKPHFSTQSLSSNSKHKIKPHKIRQKTRRTKVTTFKLGRKGKNISVLIKNNKTRRKVKREHGILKQKNMAEVKKYLHDRNLLRIGSSAPPDVLRTLYEQSILAGDITNVGAEATLQNFLESSTI